MTRERPKRGVASRGELPENRPNVVPPAESCSMSEFHTVAKVGSIPPGAGRAFSVQGRMVAVFHQHGTYFAINDFCPHMGASLAEGYVEGECVTCPWHAWRFGLKDGLWLDNPRAKLRTETYVVRVVGDEIQVQVPASPERQGAPPDSSGG
jgi:nitrite reductase (NADH) small subunit